MVEESDGGACGTLISRTSRKADFTQSSTNTQTYTFIPSGTVSNFRFFYENIKSPVISTFSGGNTGNNITGSVTAIVNFNPLLNQLAVGKDRSNALNADIIVIYNDASDGTDADKKLTVKVNVQDCACCGAYIAPGVWKSFMCYDLAADQTADPFVPAKALNGNYFRYGYYNPSGTVDNYIYTWDQTNPYISNWFGTGKSASDPCPSGFRVSTKEEWRGVIDNNTISNPPGATFASGINNFNSGKLFGSALYLPATGILYNDGAIVSRNSELGYWGSNALNQNIQYEQEGTYPNA